MIRKDNIIKAKQEKNAFIYRKISISSNTKVQSI